MAEQKSIPIMSNKTSQATLDPRLFERHSVRVKF